MLISLDATTLIKDEDAGELYHDEGSTLHLPDFRVVTKTGEHLLVKVKNVGHSGMFKVQKIRTDRFTALREYARLTGARLVFAHYWSGTNWWTMVDADCFTRNDKNFELTLKEASCAYEFGILGDLTLVTSSIIHVNPGLAPGAGSQVQTTVVYGSPPRWLSLWLSFCAKAIQPVAQVGRWITDLDDLVPAGSPGDQPDCTPWNAERYGERLERGLGGLTVHRTLLYGHDQRASRAVRSVRASDPGAARARLDPDGDADARGRLGLLRSGHEPDCSASRALDRADAPAPPDDAFERPLPWPVGRIELRWRVTRSRARTGRPRRVFGAQATFRPGRSLCNRRRTGC